MPLYVRDPTKPMEHVLKCWPEPFAALWGGLKRWEVRLNDRDFLVGDTLQLREYDPATREYTGRFVLADVADLLPLDPWCPDYVGMTLEHITRHDNPDHCWFCDWAPDVERYGVGPAVILAGRWQHYDHTNGGWRDCEARR